MASYRENTNCEGCGGSLLNPSYDDWGRFVCAACVARGAVLEGDRRAAESEASAVPLNLSDNPYRAASQMRGILGGVILLIAFFMCGGTGSLLMGLTLFREGNVGLGLGLSVLGALLTTTPLLFSFLRVRRVHKAGKPVEPPTFKR